MESYRMFQERVRDKIVLIGLTATGTHDNNPIPFSNRYSMVGAHANPHIRSRHSNDPAI